VTSQRELATLDDALVRIAATNRPITVRGVFYRAVAEGLVPKDETKGYRVVQRRLVKLRTEGEIPYGWITDGSRTVHGCVRYRDADEFASTVKVRYRQDYWRDAEDYVEVWIEKEAMVGVLKPVVLDEFGLDLYVTRGFPSITYLQDAAEDINLEDRPVYVYILTDFDPYGRNIAERIEEELIERCFDVDLYVKRIAVTEEQIGRYSLPTRPTKKSRRKGATRFEASHGPVSVELDAFPPNELRQIVTERIERHMDPWRLEQMRMVEREEREGLARLLAGGGSS
jgi:5S rRNA maturation endonuclease (ribonuclease M5)